MKKVVLKLELHDDKGKQKAMKVVSGLSGIDSITMDMEEKKLTVTGGVDPVKIVNKLRKFWHTEIVSVGPAKEPEKKKKKKEEPKKEQPKKEEPKKEKPKKEEPKKEEKPKKKKKEEPKKEEPKKEEPKKEKPKKEEPKKEEKKKDTHQQQIEDLVKGTRHVCFFGTDWILTSGIPLERIRMVKRV